MPEICLLIFTNMNNQSKYIKKCADHEQQNKPSFKRKPREKPPYALHWLLVRTRPSPNGAWLQTLSPTVTPYAVLISYVIVDSRPITSTSNRFKGRRPYDAQPSRTTCQMAIKAAHLRKKFPSERDSAHALLMLCDVDLSEIAACSLALTQLPLDIHIDRVWSFPKLSPRKAPTRKSQTSTRLPPSPSGGGSFRTGAYRPSGNHPGKLAQEAQNGRRLFTRHYIASRAGCYRARQTRLVQALPQAADKHAHY